MTQEHRDEIETLQRLGCHERAKRLHEMTDAEYAALETKREYDEYDRRHP